MTDSPTPPEPGPVDPDIELASAHHDDEADADERARVDTAAVQAHLTALTAVSERVRDVPPPPPGLVDHHVARAMEAFEADDRVVPFERTRTAARPWWQRIPLGAVAAALVFVALIGAIGLASTGGEDDTDTATAALDAAGDSGGEAATSDDSDAAAGAMEDSAVIESDEQLEAVGRPVYDGYDALADDLRAELAQVPDEGEAPAEESDLSTSTSEGAAVGADGAGADPCDAVERLGLDPATVVLVRSVLVPPDEVTVVVHETSEGERLTVVDDGTCAVVVDRLL